MSRAARQAGWDPRRSEAETVTPVLRGRLNLSREFTLFGFGASILMFFTSLYIIGLPNHIEEERLIGGPSLQFLSDNSTQAERARL